LRLEGFVALLLAVYIYARGDSSWLIFAGLFFVPDLSFSGYLAGPRVGAAIYNAGHSYAGPLVLALALLSVGISAVWAVVWIAHIAFDRALGYGLKYPSAFADTHLGRIGESTGP